MERIKNLNLYQKSILILMVVMALVFAVLYPMTISKVGYEYMDAILVPSQENGSTVYSGKLEGKQASFTVTEDKTVLFRHGDKTYGPYIAKEDPTAVPKDSEMAQFMTGIELWKGDEMLFRGGVRDMGDFYWTENADGTYRVDCEFGDGFDKIRDLKASMSDGMITIQGGDGFEMTLDVNDAGASAYADVTIEATGIGAMRLQIGANEGQVLEINIPDMSLRNMGIENLDVTTVEGARKGISSLDGALQFVSKVRGRLGDFQNRLESTVNSLDITDENMTAAYSRIMDVDMAEEMTDYTTNQVLTQAGTSMLAQANERPSQVLQLLQ